ncbi:MAG: carboxypeptidase regulatory-like domain-containing protein [Planctomycetaceae bacterium]|nr:carboxypeptidase regulatory-like domain-containing protein [Planctomycetaceae bacterium]
MLGLRQIVCLVAVTLLTGNSLQGAEPTSSELMARQVQDVILHEGQLQGQFVTGQGAAVAGARVQLRSRTEVVRETFTDATGKFSFAEQKPGIYELVVDRQVHAVRVWAVDVAPASAKEGVTLVHGDVVRGQVGTLGMIGAAGAVGAVGATTVVASTLAIKKSTDNEKLLDSILHSTSN